MTAVPACLARLRDLNLAKARGRPTALARLVFVALLLHASGDPLVAWPGAIRLAGLTGSDRSSVHRALALLRDRGVIVRVRNPAPNVPWGWRIILKDTGDDDRTRVRVFWPRPFEDRRRDDLQTAFAALVRGLPNRNHAAIATMFYQFTRPLEPANGNLAEPLPPNQAWTGRLLNINPSTVRRAKVEIIRRGLATVDARGRLVFEDPARWPEILRPIEPAASEPTGEPLTLMPAAANSRTYALAETGPAEVTSDNTDAIADVERALALAGWMLPPDPLAHEIIAKAVDTWGPIATIARLQTALAGPYPSYALEPLGAELGEEFECPYQLIRCG